MRTTWVIFEKSENFEVSESDKLNNYALVVWSNAKDEQKGIEYKLIKE